MTEDELMLTSVLDCRRVDLYTKKISLTPEEKNLLVKMRLRRFTGEPLQYVIGSCEFIGLKLKVDKRVLIPRPETELLVEMALEKLKLPESKEKISILDLGTGSGNIAVALAKLLGHCHITAVDISLEAIEVALENAKANSIGDKITFLKKDFTTYLNELDGEKFDLIISNPPYIKSDDMSRLPRDVQQEPVMALDGGADGLDFYRVIIKGSESRLKDKGFLLLEMGDGQKDEIEAMVRRYPHFTEIDIKEDYIGTDRILSTQFNLKR